MKSPVNLATTLAYRLLAYVVVVSILLSSFVHVPPIHDSVPDPVSMESKLDDSLLRMNMTDDVLDVLVSYDESASELKVRNAINYLDSSSRILETYQELSMLRVEIMGRAIPELARSEFISKIWSNDIQAVEQSETAFESSVLAEDYVSLIDRIGARHLWDQGYNGTGVVIAVLDTGVDLFHPDLSVSAFASFVEADTLPTDLIGHGTFAASVAVGTGNASDGLYGGIAPGATLLSAKVTLGGLFAAPSWIVSGIEWASSRGADIILLPFNTLGAPGDAASEAIRKATEEGIFVVTAAGDDGPDYLTIMSPGGTAEAFCVGAYDTETLEVPDFSGRGPSLSLLTKPDLVAPGVGVVGARAGGGLDELGFGDLELGDLGDLGGLGGLLGGSLGESVNDDYVIADSTTASAAVVAGAAALLIQAFDRTSPISLANTLRDTATQLDYGANDAGAGLLNLPAAFDYLSTLQSPGEAHTRTTSTSLLALGILSASGSNASTTMLMSSFGTAIAAVDQRNPQDSGLHLMMGMLSLKWDNMDPTGLMLFDVKRELHQVAVSGQNSNYNRYVGVLAYENVVFVTLVVESYDLTSYSDLPLTAFRITPFILNLGDAPIENVTLYSSYTLDLFLDGIDDHGKYDLDDEQLFAYGISEDYGIFYVGMNSSIPLSAFEVGNSSEVSDHVSSDSLTGSTSYDGPVGLGMKWDFGVVDVNTPVNVTIAMGFGENRTVLDRSMDAMWELDVPSQVFDQGDLLVVEADIPRIAEAGVSYTSRSIVMNIGYNTSSAIAAILTGSGTEEDGALYAEYFSFEELEPFQAAVVNADWSPDEEGLQWAAWAVTTGIEDILSLVLGAGNINVISLLDDFIIRDVFIIDPISSTSVFPRVIPFGPFDIRFPIDFGIYSFVVSTTEPLGNLTVSKYGNATDWGNVTLPREENVEGFYNFSLFLLAPPITVDGYHRCDYVIETEAGWSGNITLERELRYPRAMMLMDTSHGGGFGSLLGGGAFGTDASLDMGGGFNLAQDDGGSDDDGGMGIDISLNDLDSLGSLTDLFDTFRLTTFSGLSRMKSTMAQVGLDLIETPGAALSEQLLTTVSTVFIIAPTEEYNSTEIEMLRDFTASGGRLVIFGDTDEKVNHTAINPLLMEYGYSLFGNHDVENTTDIVAGSILGAGMDIMWLGGGAYIMNNQSMANARLNGNSVSLVDASDPEIVLFGSSRIFMNKNLKRCNNSILLDNLNEFLLRNTLTTNTSLSEPTDLYPAGKSVYLNLELEDYYGNPVNDLFVAIVYDLPNGSLAYFIAAFVEEGLYSSQFAPSYWRTSGRIDGIFLILGDDEYAMTYASVTFYLYEVPVTTPTSGPLAWLTMPQVALITSVSIFGTLLVGLVYNRRRMKRRLRIPEVDPQLVMEIDNTLSALLAAFTQLEELIKREDLDRIQKIEALRVLMENIEEGRRMFERVSDKVGGV